MLFGRLVTAMCTPFTDSNEIDWLSLKKIIKTLIETGTDTIVVGGTTGESPSLSHQEKLELYRFTLAEVNGRAKVVAGTGSNNTTQTISFTKEVEALGIDGAMVVAPYYNKPSQEGLYQHFKEVSKSTLLPVMVYNIPGRSSVNILPDTMVRICSIENVVCVKEACGDLNQITELISKLPKNIHVYSGDDGLTLPILSVGGVGVVSVASHIVGKELKKMIESYFNGQVKEAKEINQSLLNVFHGLFSTSSPVPLKYVLSKLNLCSPNVRLPLVETDESQSKSIDVWFNELTKKM